MKKPSILIVLMIVLSLIITSCSPDNSQVEGLNETIAKHEEKISGLEKELEAKEASIKSLENQLEELNQEEEEVEEVPPQGVPQTNLSYTSLLAQATDIVNMFKVKDFSGISSQVHPTKGLRFTPYQYIDLQNDIVFSDTQVSGLMGDPTTIVWGAYDGSGFPIILKFSDYYNEFVYDEDFLNPHMVGINNPIGYGNLINNMSSSYPNAQYVEFHFTGFDPQFGGMDWRSLTLVFEQVNGTYYLVGIVHGQWTS